MNTPEQIMDADDRLLNQTARRRRMLEHKHKP